jgi:hypothetical protein
MNAHGGETFVRNGRLDLAACGVFQNLDAPDEDTLLMGRP